MSRARKSVSDKDIRQYEQFQAKMKADAASAGAGGGFSFDEDGNKSDNTDDNAGDDDNLYG
jgi:hypothetical protein